MWIAAGVVLGLSILAALLGTKAATSPHLLAAAVGLGAIGWLIVSLAGGDISAGFWELFAADLAISGTVVGFGLRSASRRSRGPKSALSLPDGAMGIAVSNLDPDGIVRIDGEDWSAVSLNGTIQPGTEVHVINARGVRLEVWSMDGGAS